MIKHITPEHPDFAEISKRVTPIEKVKDQAFPRTSIYAERETSYKTSRTRKETMDK